MTTEPPITLPTTGDILAAGAGSDPYAYALAMAQMAAAAAAAERLNRAYATHVRLLERIAALPHEPVLAQLEASATAAERHAERIAASLDGPVAAAAVSPGQLRLVVGG